MKHIKMVIYGEPGVGKSVFASKAPKPFFITTDGNYEWLEDFGADPKDHVQVNSWEEAKTAFAKSYDNYDTIVVDLLEDLFKWCEYEYCVRNKLEHVSDVGYAKGYDATRNEFFIEICKLINSDKNVIFIMHGISFVTKDRRGVEHTKHAPSSRIPDKVIDMIEGRVRYFLRCYLKDEEQTDGTIIKNRYLSLVPKANEFGIIRGVNENTIPQDIVLDFNEFAKVIGYSAETKANKQTAKNVTSAPKKDKPEPVKETVKETVKEKTAVETPKATKPVEEPKAETEEITTEVEEAKTEVKTEPVAQAAPQEQSNADKLAAIRAKLAMINSNK